MLDKINKTPTQTALPGPVLPTLALVCKAASDELRLQILRVLRHESFGVLELCQILNLAQSKLSHHLKVLAGAGLVATRREGNSIFYRRPLLDATQTLSTFIQTLFGNIDQILLEEAITTRICQIKSERSQSSLDFFNKNSTKFSEKQALITELALFSQNLGELLKIAALPSTATAIEIGPGEGAYLPELATQFKQVIAIDNAKSMLERARQQIEQHNLHNVTLMLGDPGIAVAQQLRGDLVVFNMVLHHMPSPSSALNDAFRLLNPGGYVLIAELCLHDQEWVRKNCGDLWLGFEPEELKHWAQAAQLRSCQSLFLGLRNGFQIQLHLFHKPPSTMVENL